MKLSECFEPRETVWKDTIMGVELEFYLDYLDEGIKQAGFAANTRGGRIGPANKTLATITNNPMLVGTVAGMAISALQKYNSNKKKYTTRFYAKTFEDRRLYKKIVDDLMKTGHYKKVRTKHVDGGILWELRRKDA